MSDMDYLEELDTKPTVGEQLMKEMTEEGNKVARLKLIMEDLQFKAKEAEQEYAIAREHLARRCSDMGLSSLVTNDGTKFELETKCYCSPNKNSTDRKEQIDWLAQYGGEHLVKSEGKVDSSVLDQLAANGIPFQEVRDLNTTSVKAFITGLLGLKGGVAQIGLEDIPASFHFLVQQELKIS